MEIAGKIKGDLSIKKIAHYPSTGEKMCTAVLLVKVPREDAANFYGEWFDTVIFSSIEKDDNTLKVGFKSISPAFVFEKHRITILKKKYSVKPEITKVTPVDGEDAVLIEVIIPLPVHETMAEFYGELALAVGTTLTVEFKREQVDLPGMEDKQGTLQVVSGSGRPKGSHGPKQRPA